VHTRNESHITEQVTAADSASAAANLFELSEVCEVERAKLSPAPEQEMAGLMKPPTLVRPHRTAARDHRTPGPRSQLQPSARETCTELNPLLCHYLKTFWTNAHISAEDKLFNSLTMK
jgi:hypothetical protein